MGHGKIGSDGTGGLGEVGVGTRWVIRGKGVVCKGMRLSVYLSSPPVTRGRGPKEASRTTEIPSGHDVVPSHDARKSTALL